MKRRLIVGDIHARYDLLRDVLDKAEFNPDEDTLYSTGDICDRGDKPIETLKYLMALPDLRPVLGNHDDFLESYLFAGDPDPVWIHPQNGGYYTYQEVHALPDDQRLKIRNWIAGIPAVRAENDFVIVHAGFPEACTMSSVIDASKARRPHPASHDDVLSEFFWDRDYLSSAMLEESVPPAVSVRAMRTPLRTRKRIFIGHTPMQNRRPFVSKDYHIVAVDTGAGGGRGPITLMNMDTGEYWQSGPRSADGKQKITLP